MSSFRGKIDEQFHLENASNLTHDFWYKIFFLIYQNFLVQLFYKNSHAKFDAFSRQNR